MFARKIDKKSLPGAPFGAKDRFWIDLGVPEGTQKLLKKQRDLLGKGVLGAIW